MSHLRPSTDAGLARLSGMLRANVAIEEAFIAALSDLSRDYHDQMDAAEAAMVSSLIRRHRVGLIKQRAILGALDIDV